MTNITPRQFNLLAWFTIVVTVFLVFGQALGHQFLVNWDDPFYVSQNPYIRGFSLPNLQAAFSKFYAGHYAPVQMLSYMLDYSIWGGKPFGFILGNLIYHAVTSILVYHLLLRCGCSRLASLLGTLLFVVHPTQVESVVWIASRKNLLSMLFMLVAFHAYLSYRAMPRGERGPWYALLMGAFVLALLAKSVAVVLVPLLVIYDWAFPSDQPQPRWLDKLPLLLAAALVAGLAVFSQGPEFNGGRATWHGGSPWATFLTMLPVTATYLRLLVWPTGLSAFYDPPVRLTPDVAVIGSALLLLGLAIGAVMLARRNRPACFWALTFFIGFAPVMQIVPLVSLMNDRYFYTPLLGISGLVAVGLTAAAHAQHPRPYWRFGVTLVAIALALTTWLRVPCWRNASTLWLDAVSKAGTSGTVWSNLVEAHFEEGKLAEIPAALRADIGFSRAVERLMVTYMTRNKALKANLFAQRLTAAYPDWPTGYLALSETALLLGNQDLAQEAFDQARAVAAAPDASILVAMGVTLLRLGQPELANDALAKAMTLNDSSAELFYGMGCLKAAAGQPDEAVALLRLALAKKPALGSMLPQERLLEPLRSSSAFQQLLKEIPANK